MGKNPFDGRDAELLPLREPTFFILLSLASGEKHGYSILKETEELSDGKIRLSTGTLYEALARLVDQGLIERTTDEEATGSPAQAGEVHRGKPRKAYHLTQVGRDLLRTDIRRMQALVSIARRSLGEEGI